MQNLINTYSFRNCKLILSSDLDTEVESINNYNTYSLNFIHDVVACPAKCPQTGYEPDSNCNECVPGHICSTDNPCQSELGSGS